VLLAVQSSATQWIAVPERFTVSAELAALLRMVTLPVRLPPCKGVSVMTQLAPLPSADEHVFVCVNSALVAMLVIVTLTAAVLESVTVCVLGTPTSVPLPNTTLAGLAISAGFTVRLAITEVDPVDAVTETAVTLLTEPAAAENVWLALPAATTTDAGTGIAPGSLLVKLTVSPPAGAIPVSSTVPVTTWPRSTVVRLNDNPLTTAGFTVSVADVLLEPDVAVTTTLFAVATLVVAPVKLCEALPAGTTIPAGRVTEGSELLSETATPPAGAAGLILTLPLNPAPPVTEGGVSVTDTSDGEADGFTVRVPTAVVVPVVATTVAMSVLLTAPVVTAND